MTMRVNPFLQEGVRTYFAHPGILRTYFYLPAGLAIVLVVVWPRGGLESILRSGPLTDAFSVVAIVFLGLLLYFGGRYGAEDFSPDTMVQLREYVTLTPVPLVSVILGKAGFFFLHTFFLLLLGAPFLLAPVAVGGLSLSKAFAAFAVLGTASLAARMFGLFVLSLIGDRPLLRNVILLPGILLFVVVTLVAFPPLSPIHALLRLGSTPTADASAGGAFMSATAASSLVGIGAALVAAAGVYLVLRVSRGARGGSATNG
jgi:hypothetical protein